MLKALPPIVINFSNYKMASLTEFFNSCFDIIVIFIGDYIKVFWHVWLFSAIDLAFRICAFKCH